MCQSQSLTFCALRPAADDLKELWEHVHEKLNYPGRPSGY